MELHIKINFPSILNYDGKLVNKMGPWWLAPAQMFLWKNFVPWWGNNDLCQQCLFVLWQQAIAWTNVDMIIHKLPWNTTKCTLYDDAIDTYL